MKLPKEWRLSGVIPIFKNKGDAQVCSNYRGIKLLSHTMKLWERVIERRLRRETSVSENQFGFMPGRSSIKAIHLVRSLMEKYRERQRDLHLAFIDPEKTYDSGSAISPYLFALILDELSRGIQDDIPWCMIFADDIVLVSKLAEHLNDRLENWREALEANGLKRATTRVICDRNVPLKLKGKFYKAAIRPAMSYRAELEVETIINKKREGRLRWFGHVRRRPQSTPVRRVKALVVDEMRRRVNEPDDHELFISKLIQQKLQNEYAQLFPAIAITFDLPTVKPEDSLSMGVEHLDTIPKMESDEFIKSSVENLIPNPSESEDLSDSECDVPACDDFTNFSNILFDAEDDFSFSNNKSFFDEGILKEIYSNPLFDDEIIFIKIDPHHFNAESDLIESLLNHDSLIISSLKIDSLLDEFAGELFLLKSIPPGIDKTNCDPEEEIRLIEKLLYINSSPRPSEEFIFENSNAVIESFSPFPILVEDSDSLMEEIDLSFTLDDSMPPDIEEDDYDFERDILVLEELLCNDSLSLPENESFHFDIPSSSCETTG
nr:hypothetical protein [Tanacetum cinerariifolium]